MLDKFCHGFLNRVYGCDDYTQLEINSKLIQKIDKFMDSAQKDNSSSNSTSSGESNGNSKEQYTLTSQGNIGITSSAELLAKWRETLLNIDLMIFEECNDLFMQIF